MRIALFCIVAERTKHIHAQRSFRFLAERHKTLADGTLAKRPVTVSETTRRRIDRSPLAKRLAGETTGHPAEISRCHHWFPL